ncbi:hypothetical protein HK096_010298 [Nowakowskiella sp. JEL0078]|nr:hypothetical protein HK096_010298 [Nowakowskiella sp. JEL0078]
MKTYLKGLSASGGGDGPEAVSSALYESFRMPWRPNATKIVIIIADAPPHGLGEGGDGFPNGDPNGHDPIKIAQEMNAHGISIFCVACEPALSNYRFGVDFFKAITQITGGMLLPLTSASLLPEVVIGGAREQMDLERKLNDIKLEAERIKEQNGGVIDDDQMVKKLFAFQSKRGVQTTQLTVESPYMDSELADQNVNFFVEAKSLQSATSNLRDVGTHRLNARFSGSTSEMISRKSAFGGSKKSVFGGSRGGRGGFGVFGGHRSAKMAATSSASASDTLFGFPASETYEESYTSPTFHDAQQQISVSRSEVTEEQIKKMYLKVSRPKT